MAWEQLAPQAITRLSQDLSISPQVAAGIVGQLGYESAGLQSINEMQPVVPGSRGGFGWAQWTGPRRREFESWAQQNNMDVADPEANYQFLVHELTQTPEKKVLSRLQGIEDPVEAGKVFTDTFLRPGVPAYDKRASWVERAVNLMVPAAQAQGVPMEGQSSSWDEISTAQSPAASSNWDDISVAQEAPQAQPQASGFDEVSAPQAPPSAPRTISDEAFNTDPTWINNAKTLFQEVEGKQFTGKDEDAADWLKNYVAQTNWSLGGAGTTFYDVAAKLSPQGKQALLQSIEEYEQAPTSVESVGRAAKGLILDPANIAGLGVGTLLTKILGKKALSKGLQKALKQGLTKGVGAKTANILTGQGAQVAAGGAGVSGLEEGLRQGIQVGAGGQEELDVGRLASSAGFGAAGGLGASKLIDKITGRSAVRKFGAKAGSERQAQIDAEIAQDFQEIARNPNALIAEGADEASIATAVRNEVNKKYFGDVRRALEIVDPEELKRLDVKISLDSPKVTTQEELSRLRKTPNGNILADSLEKYQRAIALTSPEAASGSLAAKTKRAAMQYGPKIAAGVVGASTLGPMGFLLGPLAQGVSAGTAQRYTGKRTIPEVIKELSSGRGLKAAQNVSELLGPSESAISAEKLLERARRAQQSQAAKAATQQQAQPRSTLPSVLKSSAAVRQQAGLKGRPVSGAYTEFLGRTGLSNEQAIPLLREFSKDFKGGEIGKASKSLLQSKPIKDEASFYAIQDLAADIAKKRGILDSQQGALSNVSPVVNPISYAAVVNNAQAARDIAIKAAPNDQMAQFATTIAAIKSPQAKKEALDLAISQVTDAAERDFLVKYIEPLTKFGKKAK